MTTSVPKLSAPSRPSFRSTTAYRWMIVLLLTAGMIISYIDRSNLSVALSSPEFTRWFHLTDTDRGQLNSAFFWTYAFLQIPAGFLIDRYGVKWIYAGGFLAWSAASAATSLAHSFASLFSVRLLLGVGESIVTPASLRWIRTNIEEKRRGLATGLLFAGAKLGPAIGSWLCVWLLVHYGWRAMFLAVGAGALLWLVPWIAFVRDRERPSAAMARTAAAPVPLLPIFASPVIWGVMIGTFCYNYFVYFCMTWLPAYFVEQRHLSLESMSWYMAFTFGGMAIVAIVAGAAADRLIERGGDAVNVRRLFTIAGFAVASTEVFGAMSGSNTVAIAFSIVSLSGLGLATANYWALTQTIYPSAASGRIAGLQNFASNLSGVVAPLLTGWLKQSTGSYQAPMQAIWIFLIGGVASYVFLVRRENVRTSHHS